MTIQKDATTVTLSPAQMQEVQNQIMAEDSTAAELAGHLPPVPPGASDNIQEGLPPVPPTQPKSTEEILREKFAADADSTTSLLDSIAAKRRAFVQEGTEDEDDEREFNAELDNADGNPENQGQEEVTQAAQDAQATQDVPQVPDNQPRFFTDESGNRLVELNVNGVKKIVPESRVLAAAQKLEAGDERLRQASEAQRKLAADKAQWEVEQQQMAARQIQQPSVDPDAENNLRAQLRQGFERLVNEGDDTAMDALVDTIVKGRGNTPQIDPHQIASEATLIQNRTSWDRSLVQAAQQFEADPTFADVNGSVALAEQAKAHAIRLTREHNARDRNVDPLLIMQTAAELARSDAREMAAALGVTLATPPTQQVVPRAQATDARKQQLGNTVTGGNVPVVTEKPRKPANPDGGRNPSQMDSKAAAFAGLNAMRNQPAIKPR